MTKSSVNKGIEAKDDMGTCGLVGLRNAARWHYGSFTRRAQGHLEKRLNIFMRGPCLRWWGKWEDYVFFRLLSVYLPSRCISTTLLPGYSTV